MDSNFWRSENIRLRAIDLDDAKIFHAWNMDSETAAMLDFVWPPTSLSTVQEWIRSECIPRPEHDRFQLAIVDQEETVVGSISTHDLSPSNGTFSYGFAIRPEYRRKGYGREALLLLLRYMFEERRYQKCTVNVYSLNGPSKCFHESLGFQLEGTLRRMHFSKGRYFDHLMYGMTREEFAELHGGPVDECTRD